MCKESFEIIQRLTFAEVLEITENSDDLKSTSDVKEVNEIRRFIKSVDINPTLDATQRRLKLGYSPKRFSELCDKAVSQKLIKKIKMKVKEGKGGPRTFLKLLDGAYTDVLEKEPVKHGHQSGEHVVAIRIGEKYYGKVKGYHTILEEKIGDRIVDLLVKTKDGNILVVEYETGTSNIESNVKGLMNTNISKLIMVHPINKKVQEKIMKISENIVNLNDMPIIIRPISYYYERIKNIDE